jgi:hypothetical protein
LRVGQVAFTAGYRHWPALVGGATYRLFMFGNRGLDMALIKCVVTDGPRKGFKAVEVLSVEGRSEYFSIEERFLVKKDNSYQLPVRLIARDPRYDTALVQLPVEADSGANRVWIDATTMTDAPDEAVA